MINAKFPTNLVVEFNSMDWIDVSSSQIPQMKPVSSVKNDENAGPENCGEQG
jgi:hypothetical protein